MAKNMLGPPRGTPKIPTPGKDTASLQRGAGIGGSPGKNRSFLPASAHTTPRGVGSAVKAKAAVHK